MNKINKQIKKIREKWVDDIKVIACILVVLGHFFQSMTKANILPDNDLYKWFNTTIYYFHVPLFFICSGYLFQKYSKVNSIRSWGRNVEKKLLVLGVPYVTFTTATWVLKKVFSSSVNAQIGGLSDTLLLHPSSPYWYLYTLFFIFLVTVTFSNMKAAVVGLVFALTAKGLVLIGGGSHNVYAVSSLLSNEIWFVIGMCICIFNLQLKSKRLQGTVCGLIFIILSVVVYKVKIYNGAISFAMGLLACVSIILMVASFDNRSCRGIDFLAKYTMPIFLMHTLFAASLRSVLMKFGIESAAIHVVMGIGISFVGPIIATWIMRKTRWLEFFLYPTKFVYKRK